jgi:DNA-binding response OmpR family regulator
MIAEYFEQRGFAIDHAADGITGLHLAVTNHYDVIVADVMLAGMDGITICRKLREEARRDTPLLMLTARDTIDDKLAGLDAGADDYLVKPFEIRELEARVRTLLRRHRGALGVGADYAGPRDPLAFADPGHPLAESGDRTGALLAERRRQGDRVEPGALVDVDEVDARRFQADQDLAGRRPGDRHGLDAERLRTAGFVYPHRLHDTRHVHSAPRR